MEDDLYDISRLVKPVTATSAMFPGPLRGYTNGKSFFFTDDQVAAIAEALPVGQVQRRPGGGWQEVVPEKGLRILAERHIDGGVFYRFRKHWEFREA